MTNHRALTISFLTAAVVLIAAPAAAQTDCQPGDLFCAELRIGPGTGTVRIGPAPVYEPPPPPPAPEPEPPVVYVQPPAPEPPPPQVYVQPAPPPPPVQQYTEQYYVEQPMVIQQQPRERRRRFEMPESSTGIHVNVGGLLGQDLAMFGGGAAFRLRPIPYVALDIGAGVYGGNDYNGLDRITVPVTVDALIYFNPQHRFQFYAVVGIGGSYGHAEGVNVHTNLVEDRDYFHLGGQAGIGAEWRISRNFALNIDFRGFIQERVDSDPEPEFRELANDGTWLETNTSGGFVARGGMTFYFN